MFDKPANTEERKGFYACIARHDLTPLREVFGSLVIPQPNSPCVAAHWRCDAIRDDLIEAGRPITAKEAGRRVPILANPALRLEELLEQGMSRNDVEGISYALVYTEPGAT